MGKLRKLRTRFISSIGAVKRSVLRRQSQNNSTSSNPTTITRLTSLDSAVPDARTRSRDREQKRKMQVHLQAQEVQDEEQHQFQLHWNEARRIYSEPVQAIQGLSRGGPGEEERASAETTAADCLIRSCSIAETQISDEEDYDDVFLQSWEEKGF